MHLKLAKSLIDKSAINESSEVEARYRAADLGGDALSLVKDIFSIIRVYVADNDISFDGRSIRDGSQRRLSFSDVVRVDGMEPDRLASVYNFDEEGEPLRSGLRRRGRKPKKRDWEIAE